MTQYLMVGLLLPEALCDDLSRVLTGLPQAEWVDVQEMFLPLYIMGKLNNTVEVDDIKQKLAEIDVTPFSIYLQSVQYSKRAHGGGVLNASLGQTENVNKLRKSIQTVLHPLVHEQRKLPHTPRLQIARLSKGSDQRLAEYMQLYSGYRSKPYMIEAFYLLNLSSSGELPGILARFPSIDLQQKRKDKDSGLRELPSYWRKAWLS